MNRLIRLPEVIERTGLKRATIYRHIKQGRFPPPIKLTSSSSAWIEEEVTEWIEDRIKRSRVDVS